MISPSSTQLLIDPHIPRLREILFELQPVVFLKIRIDTTLQGMQSQQVCGKTMQRSNL